MSDEIVHCFLSDRGELLPRWQEAFPSAVARKVIAAPATRQLAGIIWVRLSPDIQVEQMLREASKQSNDLPIVVLSDRPNDDEALDCFNSARGYCNTHAVPEMLRRVADVVLNGGLWIGESLMQRLLVGTARIPAPSQRNVSPDWAALLTEREQQVAAAVSEGGSNKEIARLLGITERTVKAHTGAIFEKLGVRDRMQLSLLVHGHRSN